MGLNLSKLTQISIFSKAFSMSSDEAKLFLPPGSGGLL
jgi:hypothetical protein